MLFKTGVGVLLVGGIAAIVVANFNRDSSAFGFKWAINAVPPLEVKTAPVQRGTIVHTIEAPGKVEADVEVKISGQVVGRIIDLPVKEGQMVDKDDLLVQLDKDDYLAEVRSMEARIRRLEASIKFSEMDVAKSRRDFERTEKLTRDKAVSPIDLLDMETVLKKDQARLLMSRAELSEAESSLAKAKDSLAKTTIRSPLKGIVSSLHAKEGEVVIIGTVNNPGTVIMEVSDPNSRVVRARIDETYVPLLQPGQKTVVHLHNNDKYRLTGRVLRISPKGTKGTGTTASQANENEPAIFETIIALDDPPPTVRLGMTVNIEVQVEERKDVITIPAQSVLHRRLRDLPPRLAEQVAKEATSRPGLKDPAKRFHQVVFVMKNGKAEARLVQTGISDERNVEITSGLEEGDVVVSGPYRIFDKLKDDKLLKEIKGGAD